MYQYLDGLKMLEKISSLEGSVRDGDVWRELKDGENVRYSLY